MMNGSCGLEGIISKRQSGVGVRGSPKCRLRRIAKQPRRWENEPLH